MSFKDNERDARVAGCDGCLVKMPSYRGFYEAIDTSLANGSLRR
jgi:hypothetical protein